MKNIVSVKNIRNFYNTHKKSETPLKMWVAIAKKAEWNTPHDVKRDYRNASIINEDRVVFNIKGNDYRLIVSINYETQYIYIRFIGTHKEYDKVDPKTV